MVNEEPQSHLTPNIGDPPNEITVLGDVASEILLECPPKLTEIITLSDPMVDIHERIANQYQEDKFFVRILEQPHAFKNFELSNGRIFLKDNDLRILCIPDISIGDRRV